MSDPLVEVTEAGGCRIARLTGELDAVNAADLRAELEAIAAGQKVIVVDLVAVTYFDSAAISVVEALSRTVDLRVVLPAGAIVSRAFRITGLDRVVPTFESVEEASQ